jgi:hypothetical protein
VSTNEDLVRWFAASVIKLGGEVYLNPIELEEPVELKITSPAGDDGLLIKAYRVPLTGEMED